jgi:fructoselysine-6-P-deglycase FrlB-like protein
MADTDHMARTSIVSLSLLLLVACGGSSGTTEVVNPLAQAEFDLPDVNSTSQTYSTDVSPRDHLGNVSAWYFGAAG